MVTEGEDARRPPLTPEQLADLHGDVLSDDEADRIRTAAMNDPDAIATLAALDRVRTELGALRTDPAPAPPAPPEVIDRLHAALGLTATDEDRSPIPAVSSRRRDPVRIAAAAAAALVVFALGAIGITRLGDDGPSSAPEETVLADPAAIQLGDELRPDAALAVLGRTENGSLTDPIRRSDCLRANGIDPATPLLGSGPVRLRGAAGVLLLVAGPRPPQITALVVGSGCSASNPETLARTDIG
ncbi:hypothetical protein ACFWQG_16300 [Rhodococcus sp. NPDC058532]|uniref:hypothetical protein n=1 Tax=Rhodococcus sp. NPDC058532 TaxID=3346540 RepID=UPI00364AB708